MTYIEFINGIISSRGQWCIYGNDYFEMHHILPKCLGGEGDYKNNNFKRRSHHSNCIWLYPKEHFIAHKLLAEENPNNFSIVSAYWQMATKNTEKGIITLTPQEYDEAKSLFINSLKLKEVSDETKLKMSVAASKRVGDKNPMFGKHHSDQSKTLISKNRTGKCLGSKRPKDACIKTSIALKGKKKSKEAVLHMSESQKKYWENMSDEKYTDECLKRSMRAKALNYSKNFGDQSGENNPRAIKIKCVETGEIFGCIKYANEQYSIKKNQIQKCLKGEIETAGGYHWEKI